MLLMFVFLTLVFLIGISWGSFLNVWIYRIPEKRSVAQGRSACMSCNHTLNHLDLVPVFSFLFLRGKCRYCKTKLSWQYPMVELVVGLLFLLTYYCFGLDPYLWAISWFLITVNVVIAKIDWNTTMIPNVISYPSIVIALALSFLSPYIPIDGIVPHPTLLESIIGAVSCFLVFFIMHLTSNGGMGLGDAKWALFMGLILGWKYASLAIFIACVLCVIFSFIVYLFHKKEYKTLPTEIVSLKDETEESTEHSIMGVSKLNGRMAVVLGPFLAISMLTVWFFGLQILDWWIMK